MKEINCSEKFNLTMSDTILLFLFYLPLLYPSILQYLLLPTTRCSYTIRRHGPIHHCYIPQPVLHKCPSRTWFSVQLTTNGQWTDLSLVVDRDGIWHIICTKRKRVGNIIHLHLKQLPFQGLSLQGIATLFFMCRWKNNSWPRYCHLLQIPPLLQNP